MKLSVIIPCYNEEATIIDTVSQVMAIDVRDLEIIVVDDGSVDETRALLKAKAEPLVQKVIYHPVNSGKGAALNSGFSAATGDVLVVQDADLEYDPRNLPGMLSLIEEGKADVVCPAAARAFLETDLLCHGVKAVLGRRVFVLLLLLTAHKCLEHGARRTSFYLMGIVGLLSIWSSHPSVFVLPGIGIVLAIHVLKQKEYHRFFLLGGIGFLWIANFGFLYFFSLRYLTSSSDLVTFWKVGFAPMPPWSDPGWYYRLAGFILQNPVGLPATYVTAGVVMIGALSLLYRKWPLALILMLPFLLTLAASALKKYPVSGRLMLFCVPLVFMIAAEGIDRIWTAARGINRAGAFCIAGLLSLYLIYAPPSRPTGMSNHHRWASISNRYSPILPEILKKKTSYIFTTARGWRLYSTLPGTV
ncbi:MAG: glycosyltransferase family 2 protein [Desulfobacterales bacterium]